MRMRFSRSLVTFSHAFAPVGSMTALTEAPEPGPEVGRSPLDRRQRIPPEQKQSD